MRELPEGTVTFLFTDIEGSTRLLHELGDDYAVALEDHRRAIRDSFGRHGGVEVDTQGDAFFVAFSRANAAAAAAASAQAALAEGPIRVRMGLHTGTPLRNDSGYVGLDVHRGARIAGAAHGGQVLLSQTTRDLLESDVEVRDLGQHRLKDLRNPERLWQLGSGSFPPLKSLNQSNLPVQAGPLLGRDRQLGEVIELVRSTRLLTLTGPGGTGKTRLALEAAAEAVDEFRDGVWFIPLSAVNTVDVVAPTIATTLGAGDDLQEFLRGRQMLLLLDNCEQLLPALAPAVASLVSAPDVRVLATSRERLALGGEHEYSVPPLDAGGGSELFTARARQLVQGFEADEHVDEIVRRLDGLPLALELAAARVKVMRPQQILERLSHSLDLLTAGARDAPERQRTLRATIAWSHELLAPDEQAAFARLAVFPGSFELEAAEAICNVDLDAIASLVDKSLLRQTAAGRFFMLETIREFAVERSGDLPDTDEVRQRHALYFLDFAEAQPEEHGPQAPAVFERLAQEHDNLLAALAWLLEAGLLELEQRLAVALSDFWDVRGYLAEGQRWLEVEWESETPLRAKALVRAAGLAGNRGHYEEAAALVEASAALCKKLDDVEGMFRAQTIAGLLALRCGEWSRAESLLLEAAELADRLDAESLLKAECNLGYAALTRGDGERAVRLLERARAGSHALQNTMGVVNCAQNLAFALLLVGREDDAVPLLSEAAELAHRLGFGTEFAYCIEGFAAVHAEHGRRSTAARLLAFGERFHRDLGARRERAEQDLYERTRAYVERHLDLDERARAEAEGAELGLDEAMELALALPEERPLVD